jgi:hypothetical protein
MTALRQSAAASIAATQPPLQRGPSPVRREAGGQASNSTGATGCSPSPSSIRDAADAPFRVTISELPEWARNDEARSLLERILADRPDRSKPLTETACGGTASYGFRGRPMTLLRQLYDGFFVERMNWVGQCEFQSRDWHKRRDSLIDYDRRHGPDALVARLMREAR